MISNAVNFLAFFLVQRSLKKFKFLYEISFGITIALFQVNNMAISQGRRDSLKSFQ